SNVTYRPGVKMVKITTDPKTYAVDKGGVLHHVGSEQLAETLFGLNWNQRIDDVPDPFFINYKVGAPIAQASEYVPSDVMNTSPTIGIDKNFDDTMVTITIGNKDTGFVPKTMTIKKGTTVTWTNRDITAHTVVGSSFDSGTVNPGKSYSRTFNSVGSFTYACSIHPAMTGSIQVIN
ncbi:MAG: plastocyanin/azurin family copper-binding protein, partial [bacterium]|nr:plastocyanin/azurin family copper-binding protein [bacterium]